MVARIDGSGDALAGFPKKLTQDGKDKYDVTLIPFGNGYLVGYIEAVRNWKQWWLPLQVAGTKFAKLDAQANEVGIPEAMTSAPLELIGGGLTVRSGGQILWITGATGDSLRIARIGGPKYRPSPGPSPSPLAPPVPRPVPSPVPSLPPTPALPAGEMEIRVVGEGGCLKSAGKYKKLIRNANSGCARFKVEGKTFKSLDFPGQCLDLFGGRDFGLYSCHGAGSQQFTRQGDQWCQRGKCIQSAGKAVPQPPAPTPTPTPSQKTSGKHLQEKRTNKCVADTGDGQLNLRPCNKGDPSQLWSETSSGALQNAKTNKCMTVGTSAC
jgi:hypothetical protein